MYKFVCVVSSLHGVSVLLRYRIFHILIILFMIRPGKLNSQFIVTKFSVLHAGGQSLFRFHISYSV